MRLRLARLHAVSLRNMYSEHGLDAWIRSVLELVCQSLMVVSYWMPGSPQTWAASAILRKMSRALYVPMGALSTIAWVVHSPSFTTAFMNSSVTRTLWLAFWNATLPYASPVKLGSYPASMSAHAFFSSLS